MKRIAHSALLVVGFAAWVLGTLFYCVAAHAAVVGDRLIPGLMYGNCWSFAFPRFMNREGSYLIVRWADDVRLFNRWRIPHVLWAKGLPRGMPVEQFSPVYRSHAVWFPWQTIWYAGRQRNRERVKRGEPQPETTPADLN